MVQDRLSALQKSVDQILARNQRVEKDKAWETSMTRKVLIMALTYLVMVSFMVAIGTQNPFINALIPMTGFFLSTLTLNFARKLWEASNLP